MAKKDNRLVLCTDVEPCFFIANEVRVRPTFCVTENCMERRSERKITLVPDNSGITEAPNWSLRINRTLVYQI
jgi:hypothetical protein